MKINLNETVRVKLTPEGRKILDAHNRLNQPALAGSELPLYEHDPVRFQLWALMIIFGENLYKIGRAHV